MPREFTDSDGRSWKLSIAVPDLKLVREGAGIEIGKLIEDKMSGLLALLSDAEKLVDVLWALIESQAKAASVTPDVFGRAMGGDALESATNAFVQSLADFSPRPTRMLLLDWLMKRKESEDKFIQFGRKKLAAIDVTADLEREWNKSAGNSPESLGSILNL